MHVHLTKYRIRCRLEQPFGSGGGTRHGLRARSVLSEIYYNIRRTTAVVPLAEVRIYSTYAGTKKKVPGPLEDPGLVILAIKIRIVRISQ
jgi:hypothetical protein